VKNFSDDFFYTDAISERAARYIRDQPRDQPIFSYVAFYAPHFPLQAPAETIAKFRGKYAAGWDTAREARLMKQKAIGIVPKSTTLSPRTSGVPAWDTLDEEIG
jgi:arylsulfatase